MFFEKPKKKNRSRAYNRYQRKKAIKRKLHIAKDIQGWDDLSLPSKRISQFHKGKVHCSCRMCRYEQFHNIERFKYQKKLEQMDREINHYLNKEHPND